MFAIIAALRHWGDALLCSVEVRFLAYNAHARKVDLGYYHSLDSLFVSTTSTTSTIGRMQ
jgi:hypothetical protein